jgi:hypothetical protein
MLFDVMEIDVDRGRGSRNTKRLRRLTKTVSHEGIEDMSPGRAEFASHCEAVVALDKRLEVDDLMDELTAFLRDFVLGAR